MGLQSYLSQMILAQAGNANALPSCLWDFLGWDQGLPAPEHCPAPRTNCDVLDAAPAKKSGPLCAISSGESLGVSDLHTSVGAELSYKTLPSSYAGSGSDMSCDKTLRLRAGSDLLRLSTASDLQVLRFWPEERSEEAGRESLVCLQKISSSA